MTYLLDVNLLISLFDSLHPNHDRAHHWFGSEGKSSWATCPLTENAFVRILSNPAYPSVTATPNQVRAVLKEACNVPGHSFWPDSISILRDCSEQVIQCMTGHGIITDLYLVALAVINKGALATFDGSLYRVLENTDVIGHITLLS